MSRLLHSNGTTCAPRTLQQRLPEAGPINLYAHHGCTANNASPRKRCQPKRQVCRDPPHIFKLRGHRKLHQVWLPQVAAAFSRGCHKCAATSQGRASEQRLTPRLTNTQLLPATPTYKQQCGICHLWHWRHH